VWAYTGTAQIFGVPPKATNFKFVRYIHRVHSNKSLFKMWEKLKRGRIQGLPKFFVPSITSRTGKATKFKFCTHILRIDRNKSPLQISGKVAGCIVRTLETFQGTHILGASRGRLCDSSAVLLSGGRAARIMIGYWHANVACLSVCLSLSVCPSDVCDTVHCN